MVHRDQNNEHQCPTISNGASASYDVMTSDSGALVPSLGQSEFMDPQVRCRTQRLESSFGWSHWVPSESMSRFSNMLWCDIMVMKFHQHFFRLTLFFSRKRSRFFTISTAQGMRRAQWKLHWGDRWTQQGPFENSGDGRNGAGVGAVRLRSFLLGRMTGIRTSNIKMAWNSMPSYWIYWWQQIIFVVYCMFLMILKSM